MKRPPLPHTLALTAVAGAVVLLALTAPSCDPQEDAARHARTAQHRAFAEALHADPETQRADAAERAAQARATASVSSPLLPPAVNYKQDAQIASRRREFLSLADHWPPDVARKLQPPAVAYQLYRKQWMRALVNAAGTAETGNMGRIAESMERATRIYRQDFDRLCADLTQLTPEARRRWDSWEERNWEGWSRLMPDPDAKVANFYSDPANPAGNPRTVSASGTDSSLPPLLEQLEYLDDLRHRLTGEQQLAGVTEASDAVRKQFTDTAAAEAILRGLSGRADASPAAAGELRSPP